MSIKLHNLLLKCIFGINFIQLITLCTNPDIAFKPNHFNPGNMGVKLHHFSISESVRHLPWQPEFHTMVQDIKFWFDRNILIPGRQPTDIHQLVLIYQKCQF